MGTRTELNEKNITAARLALVVANDDEIATTRMVSPEFRALQELGGKASD
ncbi:hypothetical protein ACQ4M3_27810 [Leptolyngbya sp. AN03gr2]